MKIVDKKKFVKRIIALVILVILIILFASNIALSHADKQYKEIYVSNGDTLWSIAKEEKANNNYYEQMNIREIIDNIKKLNNLKSGNIIVGQKLVVYI